MNRSGPLRVVVPTTILNSGSPYMFRSGLSPHSGLEVEQCEMVLRYARIPYELHFSDDPLGDISPDGIATGILGQVQNDEYDLVCARAVMSPRRRDYFKFSFPSQYEVTQVFMIRDDSLPVFLDSFLFRPFSTNVWVALLIMLFILVLLYTLFRFFEFRGAETRAKHLTNGFYMLLETFTEIRFGAENTGYHSRYHTVRIFTVLWIMLFMRVFVDYYGSNLRKILIFSDNIELPFQDFRGFLLALQMGEYRLLTSSTTQIPVCPYEYYDRCDRIFEEIFAKYPPIIGSYQKLAQDEFVRKHPYPLVAFAWLPGHRITSEYSTLTDRQFHSHVWVIRNVNIFPASLIFNKRVDRKLMERIDNAVITLLGALETVDLHYDPIYPPVSIQQLPTKTAFTLRQLSVIFYVLLGALGISLLALVVEINFSYLKLQLGRPYNTVADLVLRFLRFTTKRNIYWLDDGNWELGNADSAKYSEKMEFDGGGNCE